MFARKLKVEHGDDAERQLCPQKWMDSFAMRSFTNDQVFDETLPIADGWMEASYRVPLERLVAAMDDWFRRKSYLKPGEKLYVQELPNSQLPAGK